MIIISGGQMGVDRAALDAAGELGLPRGGWCPAGRWAEDGPISPDYPLRETPSADSTQRTEWNVRDADATLVLAFGEAGGGTARTIEAAQHLGKPLLVLDLAQLPDPQRVRAWIGRLRPQTLNVAGPRESEQPGIYRIASKYLRVVLGP